MRRRPVLLLLVVALAAGCADDSPPPYGGGVPPKPPVVIPGPSDTGAPADGALADGAPGDLGVPDGSAGCGAQPGTIKVTGGDLVGATVAASAPLIGTVQVEVDRRDGCSSCPFYLVVAGTWEDASSITSCDGPIPAIGPVTRVITVGKLAPQTPGTHQLIIAGHVNHTCLEILSGSTGAVTWSDGNDITDWPVSGISGGSTCVKWLSGLGLSDVRVPAATVDITVQ